MVYSISIRDGEVSSSEQAFGLGAILAALS